MTNFNETLFRESSYEQIREADYQKLMASVAHNVQQAEAELTDTTAANPLLLAAVFNDFAYIGGTMYNNPRVVEGWVAEITAKVSMYQWEVVWGPSWHYPGSPAWYESDACVFIARNRANGDMMVVIRGTNFLSMDSWLQQDFDTGVMVNIADMVPNVPKDALVARGTHKGLGLITNLHSNGHNVSFYLSTLPTKPNNIFITGHSLGGTLVPPMFVFLNHWLNKDINGSVSNIIPISFAGLTPGETNFNNYFNKVLYGRPFYRFVNSLDIAPYCWYSKHGVLTIYDDNEKNHNGCGTVWFKPTPVIDVLFWGIEGWYQEINSKYLLGGHCSQPYDLWETLAMYQHHVTTYLALMVGNSGKVRELWEARQETVVADEVA